MNENVYRFSPKEPFLRDLRRAIRVAEEALEQTALRCLLSMLIGAIAAAVIQLLNASRRSALPSMRDVVVAALIGAITLVAVVLARTAVVWRQLSVDRRTRRRIEHDHESFYDRRTCEEVAQPCYRDYRRRSYVLRDEAFPARLIAG